MIEPEVWPLGLQEPMDVSKHSQTIGLLDSYDRCIPFKTISTQSNSPQDYGYTIVPVYETPVHGSKHKDNCQWIEDSLNDNWTWFAFGGFPKPGISYCFLSKEDAGMFILCKTASTDGTVYKAFRQK